jgi:CheY-like chemotaxis protein
MNQATPLVAVVSADTAYLELVSELLNDEGYRHICYHSNVQAPALIQRDHPDLVILDVLAECSNSDLAVLTEMRRDPATGAIPTIVCSTDGPLLRTQEQQLRTHNGAIVEKPFDIEYLLAKVAEAVGSPASLSLQATRI